MEPQLKVGGVVVTRPVEAGEIKVGDIITFHSPLNEELTSHRVIAVEDGSTVHFQTKGMSMIMPTPLSCRLRT